MLFLKKIKLQAIILIACSFFSILLFGCSENKRNNVSDIRKHITDTISLPFHINQGPYFWRIKSIEDSAEIITYLKNDNFTLYRHNISKNKTIDSFSLRKYQPIFVDYVYQGMDSLIILLENYQVILITPDSEKVYDLKPLFLEHIDSLAFPGEKNNAIDFQNNILSFSIATNRPRHDFTKPNPNEILYNYIIQVRLDNDSIRFVGKYNPYDPEILENGYYEFRHHYFSNPNTLTYFYDFKNEIFQINLENNDTIKAALIPTTYKWEKSKSMNYDSLMNYYYLFNYVNDRYTINNFLFDPYTKHSLFFLKKPNKHYKDDGSITNTNEYEFTLFILDADMKVVKEIAVPPHIINGSKNSFLTRKGLYLPIAKEFQNLDKDETLYYRINLD